MKRFLVLLVVLAGGLAAAALTVPDNAAVVNGSSISQQSLSSDVSAIAGSPYYQCYLNSQEYLSSNGEQQLPTVAGAGQGQNPGDNPTASTAFVATYLDTAIGHQLVLELAAQRGVTVTPAQLANARTSLSGQISSVMSEVSQSEEGQNPRYTCSVSGEPLTGEQVLATLPASFVDQQVQFVATASALQEDLSGVGSSEADLQAYFDAHPSEFDTACFTVAVYSSEAAANEAAASVAFGTPFAQVAKATQGGGPQGCDELPVIASQLPTSAKLDSLGTGAVSAPISYNGNYLLLQITSRTPTTYAKAKPLVAEVVQSKGSGATQKAITAVERRASVDVDPRYGVWVPVQASVFPPLTPQPSDVLNAPANEAGATTAASSSSSG